MRFNLLIFSFVTKQLLHRKGLNFGLTLSGIINKNIQGCDHRYFNSNETFSMNDNTTIPIAYQTATLEDIYSNIITMGYFYKLKLLKKLTSSEISDQEKIQHLEIYEGYNNNSKHTINLTAGGLFKDWNATII